MKGGMVQFLGQGICGHGVLVMIADGANFKLWSGHLVAMMDLCLS